MGWRTLSLSFEEGRYDGILEENGKAPVRSYYCEFCCGYHVTSILSLEDGERLDHQDSQLIQKLTTITQVMDKFKMLGVSGHFRPYCVPNIY